MKDSTWRNFDKKKPPNAVRVLVSFDIPEWGVFIAAYYKETPIEEAHWHFDNAAFNMLMPKYWLPLPEPPAKESNAE